MLNSKHQFSYLELPLFRHFSSNYLADFLLWYCQSWTLSLVLWLNLQVTSNAHLVSLSTWERRRWRLRITDLPAVELLALLQVTPYHIQALVPRADLPLAFRQPAPAPPSAHCSSIWYHSSAGCFSVPRHSGRTLYRLSSAAELSGGHSGCCCLTERSWFQNLSFVHLLGHALVSRSSAWSRASIDRCSRRLWLRRAC